MSKRKRVCLLGLLGILIASMIYYNINISTFQIANILNDQNEKEKYQKIDENTLYARAAVLMDGSTGRVLYGKNETEELANASTTKILTAIIALEKMSTDSVFTASEKASNQPKVHLGVVMDEQIKLQHLLYSLMLESHNDSAVMIAEGVAGSVEEFADLMNQKAKEIGCEHSYFITPNGLDSVNDEGKHHTTAEDLARILKYCITESSKSKEFISICSTPNYTFSDEQGIYSYQCHNHNALMNQMDGVIAGKTGFTGDAGYCYVGAVENSNRIYIIALLACGWPNNKNYKWKDAKTLLGYGMDNYQIEKIKVDEIEPLPTIEMKNWANTTYQLGLHKTIYPQIKNNEITILMADWEQISISYQIPERLNQPITKNTLAGYASVYIDGRLLERKEVVYIETLHIKNFYWYFQAISRCWMA